MNDIAVIIPFFQRESGILVRALNSVLRQTDLDSVTIHVVDDGSPIDPAAEIAQVCNSGQFDKVVLHRKSNGGPGSARNLALDHIDNTEWVAFLDSDDEWSTNHIESMRRAIDLGADFYFCDYRREGVTQSRFSQTKFEIEKAKDHDLYECGNALFSKILYGSPVGTSTVGYRKSKFPNLRFMEKWNVGEDNLFWMEIVSQAPKSIFAPGIEVSYGRGVNIFEGVRWGTTADLVRQRHTSAFHTYVSNQFKLNIQEATWNFHQLRKIDLAFMISFVSAIRNREHNCVREFGSYAWARPKSALRLFDAIVTLIAERLNHRKQHE